MQKMFAFQAGILAACFNSVIVQGKGAWFSHHFSELNNQPWPNVCTGSNGSINQTRCPADQTCCNSNFSGSGKGCCPWADAVCCQNGLTCCPKGTKCVDTLPASWPSWAVTTSCQTETSKSILNVPVPGKCACKPGPPLSASTSLKNVLVIGDSVSLGYTPTVANLLADAALVQHAPWGGDGGAEETAYGLQCIKQWLFSPNGTAFTADLVYFNFGLHDGPQLFLEPPANVTIPGQEGNMTVYADQLVNITYVLKDYALHTGAKLIFALTSPMMAKEAADNDVQELNRRAALIMSSAKIPTVDLHSAVVSKCGPVPQASCFGAANCFSPHCVQAGYDWLANSTIVPAIRALL